MHNDIQKLLSFQDFLKDVGEKEEQYYSQRDSSESSSIEPSPKRHKSENLQSDLGDITFDSEPDFARSASKSTGKSSRESGTAQILLQNEPPPKLSNGSQPPCRDEDVESRRNLALEILRKEASKNNSQPNYLSQTSTPLQRVSPAGRRNSQSVSTQQSTCQKDSLKIFKKPVAVWTKSPAKRTLMDSPNYRSAPCMTLVRKFPGPAGLLPDSDDTNLNNQNLLSRLDEHKIDIVEKLKDPSMSDYCSQNTERLFSVGAWRSMLDDLPADFLRGHEIATIKRWARSNCGSCENSRASFLAGVIQRIDHSVENPRLVLKDLSDSIEATMHRDIPLTYPNILEPGVVILLRNVGLLGFTGSQSCPGLQFHVMIAPKNVLAVYNDKARVVTSSWMESIRAEASAELGTQRASESIEATEDTGQKNIGDGTQFLQETDRQTGYCVNDDDVMDDAVFACIDTDVIEESQRTASLFKPASNIVKIKKCTESRTNCAPIEKSSNIGKAAESGEKIVMRPESMATVRSRLLQYRSNDVLSPAVDVPNVEDSDPRENSRDENPTAKSGAFGDDLLDSDNDTDDEIISQLDVDSILTNYNSGT